MNRAVGDTARGSCRSGVLDGCFDVVLDACRSCAASWRGTGRAHCRRCHATSMTRCCSMPTGAPHCVPPLCPDLVWVDGVRCRLLAGEQTVA